MTTRLLRVVVVNSSYYESLLQQQQGLQSLYYQCQKKLSRNNGLIVAVAVALLWFGGQGINLLRFDSIIVWSSKHKTPPLLAIDNLRSHEISAHTNQLHYHHHGRQQQALLALLLLSFLFLIREIETRSKNNKVESGNFGRNTMRRNAKKIDATTSTSTTVCNCVEQYFAQK